jgi:hypothetical protein
MEHVGDGGERLHDDAAGRQRRLDLTQRDPRLAQHKGPQVVRVLLQQETPVASNLRRGRAAGLAHPPHQLDRRRGAHGEAAGRLPDRTATFDSMHDPLTEILGQGRSHDELHRSHPQHPGIRTLDSVQARTALVVRRGSNTSSILRNMHGSEAISLSKFAARFMARIKVNRGGVLSMNKLKSPLSSTGDPVTSWTSAVDRAAPRLRSSPLRAAR